MDDAAQFDLIRLDPRPAWTDWIELDSPERLPGLPIEHGPSSEAVLLPALDPALQLALYVRAGTWLATRQREECRAVAQLKVEVEVAQVGWAQHKTFTRELHAPNVIPQRVESAGPDTAAAGHSRRVTDGEHGPT